MRAYRAPETSLLMALMSLSVAPELSAATDPWIDQALQEIRGEALQELVGGTIDYIALRTAMRLKPDILQAQLDACGACAERAALEKELAMADRDKQAIESLEAVVVQVYKMDTWTAWKMGIKVRPDSVMLGPQPCIALYDRAIDCAVEHDERDSWRAGGVCRSEYRLFEFCVKGDAQPFYQYASFLRRKAAGEFVSEVEDEKYHYYYNVDRQQRFPLQPVVIDAKQYIYEASTDNVEVGSLRSLGIIAYPWNGVSGLSYTGSEDFLSPWSKIVHEDALAASKQGRLIECRYVSDKPRQLGVFFFWYGPSPDIADTERLRGRMENHPMLRIGPSVDACPLSTEEATAMNPIVPRDVLRKQYAGMLR